MAGIACSMTKQGKAFEGVPINSPTPFTERSSIYWDLFLGRIPTNPPRSLPQDNLDVDAYIKSTQNGVHAVWLGHSTLWIRMDGMNILTDPVFTQKLTIFGPTRFNKNMPVTLEALPPMDAVIISHSHYDHLDKESVKKLAKTTARFIVPLRVGKYLQEWGVPEAKIQELNWWENIELPKGLVITATPSQHFSGRGFFDHNKTLWASWVVKTKNQKIFFSGDTGYFDGLKEIGEKFGPFDVSFLECGAYNKQWANIHMFPEQTVQAARDLKSKMLQPIHWGSFNLSLHAWFDPVERVVAQARETSTPIVVPKMGQVVDYMAQPKLARWWADVMSATKTSETTSTIEIVQESR